MATTLPYRTSSTTILSQESHSSKRASNMGFFKKLSVHKSTNKYTPPIFVDSKSNVITEPNSAPNRRSAAASLNPAPRPRSNRNPAPALEEAPPAYSRADPVTTQTRSDQATTDSPYAFLGQFDTIFLIDDSGSMAGRSWRETSAALAAITPICTAQDADGIDIFFLNHRNPAADDNLKGYTNVTSVTSVEGIFSSVRPTGGTPTGLRLNQILRPYLIKLSDEIQRRSPEQELDIKPLNIIVITDGVATDDVESVIVTAAKKLDQCNAEPWQVGIQFFQVGQEPEAAEDLQQLDDALSKEHGIRDIVDTVPWNGQDGSVLTAEGIMKVTMGAINRKLDRRRGSDERLRQ